jgi:hypothetical protein
MNNPWRAVAGAALVVIGSEAALAQSGSATSVRIPAAIQSIPQTNEGLAEFLWKNLASDAAREDYSVGAHRIVDIDRNGTSEIVVTLSTTPRLVFNELLVLSGLPNGTAQVFRHTTESLQTLEGVIVDLDKDGVPEFIVPTEYAFGSGPHRVVWKVVLGWSAKRGFVDESGDHIEYYESLLGSARSDVSSAERELSADSNPTSKELLAGKQMILDRLLRVTRRDVDAPLRRALAWSDDKDATIRRLAVRVLATFPNDAAMAKLRKLSDDPDGLVRERARSAVMAASK